MLFLFTIATQCRVSFLPGAELGYRVKGQQRAETTLDFLKQQQRAPYFPTLVLQVTLVIRLCRAVSSNIRTQRLRHSCLELPLAFSSS